MTLLTYKGYTGKVDVDLDAKLLYGEVIDLKDVITFQGKSVEEITEAFQDSVDDYIDFCESEGVKPEKPFSGKFVLRLTPEQHRLVTVAAAHSGSSLNAWATNQLVNDAHEVLKVAEESAEFDAEKV